jgi:predicted nucleic acid-binding protein
VLLEVGNALARNFKPQAVTVIDEFLNSAETELVRLDAQLFEEALTLYRSHSDKEWGLVDCVSFAVMRSAGVTEALTHDRHFVQAGFRALMRGSSSS